MRTLLPYSGLLAVLVVVGACKKPAAPVAPPKTVADARAFAAKQPRYLRGLPHTDPPAGLADLSAETCGACHRAIYDEWKISTHARAWLDDAQFLAELDKSAKQGVDWMCMNCHTPVENQLPRLVAGLQDGRLDRPIYVDNPAFDAKLQKEAITCATCHVRDGVVLGPYGDTKAPHPVKKQDGLLTVEVCTQCHQAQARFDTLGLVCVFGTGAEHAASPQAAEGKTCQSCHMPLVERPLTNLGQDFPVRKTRRHWFGGSLIPKKPEFAAELEALRAHYPPGLAVRPVPPPEDIRAGQRVELQVEIENAEAGHYLPTGDPERFLQVEFRVIDEAGAIVAQRKERIGIVYEWYPKVKKLSDNRLAPLEKRNLTFGFEAPGQGRLRIVFEASRWRINEENLEYHGLVGKYVAGQAFYEESFDRIVR